MKTQQTCHFSSDARSKNPVAATGFDGAVALDKENAGQDAANRAVLYHREP